LIDFDVTTPLPSTVQGASSNLATPCSSILSFSTTVSQGFFFGLRVSGGLLPYPGIVIKSPG